MLLECFQQQGVAENVIGAQQQDATSYSYLSIVGSMPC